MNEGTVVDTMTTVNKSEPDGIMVVGAPCK